MKWNVFITKPWNVLITWEENTSLVIRIDKFSDFMILNISDFKMTHFRKFKSSLITWYLSIFFINNFCILFLYRPKIDQSTVVIKSCVFIVWVYITCLNNTNMIFHFDCDFIVELKRIFNNDNESPSVIMLFTFIDELGWCSTMNKSTMKKYETIDWNYNFNHWTMTV